MTSSGTPGWEVPCVGSPCPSRTQAGAEAASDLGDGFGRCAALESADAELLGLPTCVRIVKSHGGELVITETSGGETTVSAFFPNGGRDDAA